MFKKIFLPGLVAGIAMTVVGIILNYLIGLVFPGVVAQYQTAMFRPWSDPLMQAYFAYPFILGWALAWIWDLMKTLCQKPTALKRGLCFGLSYWIIAAIPGMFVTYTSFTVSFSLVLSWTIVGLINAIVAGWVLAKMNK